MKNGINEAIKAMTEKSKAAVNTDEALKFTQAVLNMAHAKQILQSCDGGLT